MDKRDRAKLHRNRLTEALSTAGMSQAALGRAIGADRSTISQLVSPGATRVPNGHFVAEAAQALGVSSDWLLGLSDHPESAADVLKGVMAVAHAERIEVGAQITRWHEEAHGYKIRHVPATLPDLLMTQDLIDWESREMLGRASEQERGFAEAQRDLMRTSRSDYEIAMPKHEIEAMARGEGYYRSLPVDLRLAQIDWMLSVYDELYPSLRLFFFDARQVFSSPITIFGPLQAVIYLGRHYLAFRDSERVQLMTQHFDWLVREAVVGEREASGYLRGLRSRLGG